MLLRLGVQRYRLPTRSLVRTLRQAEIQNLRVSAIGHKYICGLDISMHDPLAVRSV